MGLSRTWYRDFAHHPLKQGFDYFYGLPLTNLRDFDEDEVPVFLSIRPYAKEMAIGILIGSFMLLFALRRAGSIGPKRLLFFSLLMTVVVTVPLGVMLGSRGFNSIFMRDYEVVEQPIRLKGLTKRLVQESVEFMEKKVDEEKPFLLFVSWLQVHTALHAVAPFAGNSKHGECNPNYLKLTTLLKTFIRQQLSQATFSHLVN